MSSAGHLRLPRHQSVLSDSSVKPEDGFIQLKELSNNMFYASTTDLMSAWGAIIGGGATAIAATAGVFAAIAAVRTLRATKRDSRDRTRPMVGAELVLGSNPEDQNAYLVIRTGNHNHDTPFPCDYICYSCPDHYDDRVSCRSHP